MSITYMNEEYFDLPHDLYGILVGRFYASRTGKVISVLKTAKGTRIKVLRFTPTGKGYFKVRLSGKGARFQPLIQRLMAQIFLNLRDPNLEVDHIDGDKSNNNIENLRVVDHAENMRNAKRNGAFLTGLDNPAAKYSDELIEKARTLRGDGLTLAKIEDATGIPKAYLSEVFNGKKRSVDGKPHKAKHRKLTGLEAAEILKAYTAGTATQYQLAQQYGVSQTTISNVFRGKVHQRKPEVDG